MNLKSQPRSARGMTTLEITIVAAIILVILFIALPNFIPARTTRSADSCLSNLMWVERAKEQWANEKKQPAGATPTPADLLPYLQKLTPIWNDKPGWQKPPTNLLEVTNYMFTCPFGGAHTPPTVGQRPDCLKNPKHWEENAYQQYYGKH